MNKKLKKTFGLASSLLLLTACSSVSSKDIAEANNEIDEQLTEIIKTDEQLKAAEDNFVNEFQSLIIEDSSLDSLNDENTQIIQNLEERKDTANLFEEQATIIENKAEYLAEYDGDELDNELIQKISNQFLQFSEMMNNYEDTYQESITFQKDYLSEIAHDDADYEDFTNGLKGLNENYLDLQESKETLDKELKTINEDIYKIKELTKEDTVEEETDYSEDGENSNDHLLTVNSEKLLNQPEKYPQKFIYDSGVDIDYPEDGVKGIYTTSHSASGERMDSLIELINTSDLNSMVIDIKDDEGNITIDLESENELINEMTNGIIDSEELMTALEENDIYPIARIVVFKDTLLAHKKSDWSFTNSNGKVWENRRGESFVNPYLEEVWDYNIEIAVEAAKLGFKEIQFDYVRFPEGFENRADSLNYATGDYVDEDEDVISMEYRNRAVTEFVRKSKEELMPYGTDLAVDIFGYAALVRETPGIGQSFPGIAKEVDVISSMIYPSHWGLGNLGINKPDLEPYNVVNNYIEVEEEIFEELGEEAPTTRPWLQDFTASYLGSGNYKSYGAAEVTAQIEALADNDIHEYLLWNAGNKYSEGAKYKFN